MREDPNMTDGMMENMMTAAITEFQMFFGFSPTGKCRSVGFEGL
jgi:hypothetical protein